MEIGAPEVFWKAYCTAWDECIELQCTPKDVWVGNTVATIQTYPRIFLGVLKDDVLAGGLYLVHENSDPHVGSCMSVVFQYVLPEYRNIGVSRRLLSRAIQLTKQNKDPVIAYSHRLGDWRYETVYRRIPYPKSCKP